MSTMENLKFLREKTGAGMVDCKKALEETGGDIEKAVEVLRKKGIAKAAKRSERDASEGIIKVATNDTSTEGYIVEINAETDFVARNEKFLSFAEKVMKIIEENKPKNRDDLMGLSVEKGTVKETLDSLSGVIGEKLDIKDVSILSSQGTVVAYSHLDGKIGVLVALDQKDKAELGHNIAMQIAAASPKYITSDEVPAEETDKEKEIYKEQLLKEGKPENIIGKILIGKINKYYEETCLVDQEYIKDDKKKVKDILGDTKVEKFIRFSLV